ncbi:MAG: DUF6624 domain-containing protein [Cyanobacteria bacterium J06642_2]
MKEPKLQRELKRRAKVDREGRTVLIEWIQQHGLHNVVGTGSLSEVQKAEYERARARVSEIDAENTKWLQDVVKQYGWPTISLVGEKGKKAAWLLVQHADAEPSFQRYCLDLMLKQPKNEVSQSKLAYLKDRVLLAEGKSQLYGTQFTFVDGKWQPFPLEDAVNVDKRRAEVELPTLAENIKQIEKRYGK